MKPLDGVAAGEDDRSPRSPASPGGTAASQAADDAGAALPPVAGPASPWGIWTSIAWVAAAFGLLRLVDLVLANSPLSSLGRTSYLAQDLVVILSWATPLLVLVVAVLQARCAVARYFAWSAPRAADALLAIAAGIGLRIVMAGLIYVLSQGQSLGLSIKSYEAALNAGASPWFWIWLQYPAFLLAPIVEESVFRGFLWRGLAASRLGSAGALLLTTVLFAAAHPDHYIQAGEFRPLVLLSFILPGLVLGLLRWRTGSTTICIITHALTNLGGDLGTVLVFQFNWDCDLLKNACEAPN